MDDDDSNGADIMRVGVISDTHDRLDNVRAAIAILRERGVQILLHCGDIETIETVQALAEFQVHYVLGNWDGDWIRGVNCGLAPRAADGRKRDSSRLRDAIAKVGACLHEPWGDLELAGRQIAWVHGHERTLLRELEFSGCYDYLFHGHTHVAEQHRTGRTLVVNPGGLFKVYPFTFAIVDLQVGEVDWIKL